MKQIKNFSIYGISKLFSSLISFLIVPIYSFFLSESDFGKIAIISTIIAFISIFINCSLTVDYTLKFFKMDEKERRSYRINIIYFSIFMYVIWNILLYIFFKEIEVKLKLEIPFKDYLKIILISLFNCINNFLLEDSKMLGNAKEFAISNLLIVIINSFFILIGVKYLSLGLIGFINAQFFSSVLIFILLISKEKIQKKINLFKLNINKIKKGLLFGYPIMITFVFSYFSTYADRYILQDLTNYKLLGLYSMGYKFGEAFNIVVVNSYILAVHPILLKIYSENLEEYKNKIKIFYDYFILIFIVYFLALSVGIKFIYSFLKKEYIGAMGITEIVTISYFIFGLSQIFSMTVLVKGKVRNLSIATILSGVINVLLNYLLIPNYKGIGAAIATLISYIFYLLLTYLYAQKLEKVRFSDNRNLKLVTILLVYYFIIKIIYIDNIFIDLILKSFIFVLFLFTLYIIKLYPEINSILLKKLKRKN